MRCRRRKETLNMAAKLIVNGHTFSSETPTICVPITGAKVDEILAQANEYAKNNVEMVEWRADLFESGEDVEVVLDVLGQIREILQNSVLLFTVRSKVQGGQGTMASEPLLELLKKVSASKNVDIIDVEVDMWRRAFEVVDLIHEAGVKVIGSYHDFNSTPSIEEMGEIFGRTFAAGVDIVKLAVMPKTPQGVANLLLATSSFSDHHDDTPVISMSMGRLGAISRIGCYTFGSCVTFAALGETSAPGQLGYAAMREIISQM